MHFDFDYRHADARLQREIRRFELTLADGELVEDESGRVLVRLTEAQGEDAARARAQVLREHLCEAAEAEGTTMKLVRDGTWPPPGAGLEA